MSQPQKKKKKRRRYKLVWPSQNPAYLKEHPELAGKKKRKKKKRHLRYQLTWQGWVIIATAVAIALALIIPRVADDSKLKGLGYSKTSIAAIRKDKLVSTILDNKWYSEYLDQSFSDGTVNTDYLQLYTTVTSAHSDVITALDDRDFLLYSRLLDKGYTVTQAVRLFGNLHFWEITPLLVFDYQADDQAYIDDCVSHRDVNSQDHFELSGSYYTYYGNTLPVEDSSNVDMLVNKTYYLDSTYTPKDVTDLSSYYAATGRQLAGTAAEALKDWCNAGRDVGVTFYAASAYRDYDSQDTLYNNYVGSMGQSAADAASARPGFSEHQTGYAVDIAATNEDDVEEFKDTKAYTWTSTNCMDYGWILRYPEGKETITGYEFESWHYRYLGKELAQAVSASHLTYDEYYCLYLKGWDDEANKPSDEIIAANDYRTSTSDTAAAADSSASPAASASASASSKTN